MDRRALQAARERAQAAAAELERLKSSSAEDDRREAWANLLIQMQRAFSKLAAGASGPSSAWWGQVTRQRRSDPLLSYLLHARNADEHGIENVAALSGKARPVRKGEPVPLVQFTLTAEDGSKRVLDSRTDPMLIVEKFELKLLPVTDRGVRYELPAEHLGAAWASDDPIAIGEAGWTFLQATIDDATHRFGP